MYFIRHYSINKDLWLFARSINLFGTPGEINLKADEPGYAHRFEVYYKGLELANGYWELTDPKEQAQRFAKDNRYRNKLGLPNTTIDTRLMAALNAGLPDCAGVALGVDRLIMLALGKKHINDVLSFGIDRA